MSEQIPLTREALLTWASVDDASITCRLARSALAYMHTLDAVIVERNEAYRQRDGYELQIIDACDILGAAPDELLSDAARRATSEPENVSDAANILSEAFLIDDFGNSIEDLAKQAADQIASVRGSLLVPDDGTVAIHARDIRDSLAGERGATVSERVAFVMAELRRLRAAEAEPPQVFRPPISVTVRHACGHPFAEVVVGAIQDPAFLALPLGARLGLVVCDG